MSPVCFRPAFDGIQATWLDYKQDSGGVPVSATRKMGRLAHATARIRHFNANAELRMDNDYTE
jgi:hypothetical protein